MSALRIRTFQTDELDPDRFAEIDRVCSVAFERPFGPIWERVGPGLHVVGELDGRFVSHAMIVDRRIYFGHEADIALDAAYVENVAALPEVHGRGYGTAVMQEIGRVIQLEYELGALATGSHHFYERLGWVVWQGPTSVRMPDGERVRSARSDGHVLVLRTPRTPAELHVDTPISIDWRSEEPW